MCLLLALRLQRLRREGMYTLEHILMRTEWRTEVQVRSLMARRVPGYPAGEVSGSQLFWDVPWGADAKCGQDTISSVTARQIPPSRRPHRSPSLPPSSLTAIFPKNAGTRAFDGRRFFSSSNFVTEANYLGWVLFDQSRNRLHLLERLLH